MARHLHTKPLGELEYDAAELLRFIAKLDEARSIGDAYLGALDAGDPLQTTVQNAVWGCADALADLRSDLKAIRDALGDRSRDDGRPGTARLSYASAI